MTKNAGHWELAALTAESGLQRPQPGQAHLWCAAVPPTLRGLDALNDGLALDELARAERYRREQDRSLFVVGRGLLRRLLSAYLGLPARRIVFGYGENGKPALARPQADSLSFNVSHSGGMIVYAFAYQHAVGVDIEYMNARTGLRSLAEHVMCDAELRFFNSLPLQEQLSAFYDLWTLKEAYIKALGAGLSLPLNEIAMTFGPSRAPTLVHAVAEATPSRWSLRRLSVPSCYAGALAFEGEECMVDYRVVEVGSRIA